MELAAANISPGEIARLEKELDASGKTILDHIMRTEADTRHLRSEAGK